MNAAEHIAQSQIVAILRGSYGGHWVDYAEALIGGGITAIEITLNSPGALDGIRELKATFGGRIALGAGTVLTVDGANAAIDAGAEFVVAPDTDEWVINTCKARNIPVYPGAYTPTEVKRAFNLGATMVKLFPATSPEYVRAVRAPLNHIPLMVTGGVSADNAAAFLRAGAAALGVGGSLVSGSVEEIAAKARQLRAAVDGVAVPAK